MTVLLDGVGVRDRDGWAPRGVTGVLRPGTLTVVTGVNGVGKTTLLHVIAGLVRPDEGRVSIDGVTVSDIPRSALVGRIAMTAQPPLLVPGTVAANLAATGSLSPSALDDAAMAVGFDEVLAELPTDPPRGSGRAGSGCRADNANGSPSPARSPATPTSSCSTSRPHTSTPTPRST